MVQTAALPGAVLADRGWRHNVTLAALGIVYGDIGTSPLYAVRQSLVDFGDMPRCLAMPACTAGPCAPSEA